MKITLCRISWEFIIYCFPISFAHYLHGWLLGTSNSGLVSRIVPTPPSYTEREKRRLQLKSLTTRLTCMQLVKYHILKYSVDEDTQFIYDHIAQCQRKKAVEWCERTPWKGTTPIHQWVVQKTNLTSRSEFYHRTKAHWPDDEERTHELRIISDTRYIRRTFTCLPVWHGRTRLFPGMGDSHADGHYMEQTS